MQLINLLYPPACPLCHERTGVSPSVLCANCLGSCERCGPVVCQRCGMGLPGAFDARLVCAGCRKRPLTFEMARAPWTYTGPIREAIHRFKYAHHWRIGRWLAREMSLVASAAAPLAEVDAIVPVPLHWIRRRLKGFDHAAFLAQDVAGLLRKPCATGVLRKRRWTRSQTRLTGHARVQNVQDAFTADERGLRGMSVMLVDDVLTSGATANACAKALKAAGARRIAVLTAARASCSQDG